MEKEFKNLIVEEDFVTDGKIMDAICKVQIYKPEPEGGYEIILSKPSVKDYRGISAMNFFEQFATRIRAKYLHDVPAKSISWYDFLEWEADSYEDQMLKMKLDWDGEKYLNPEFIGRVV